MKSNQIIGLLLIVIAIYLGYEGVNKISDSRAGLEIMDVEIGVKDTSGQQQGYIYLGLAVLLFGGGLYTINKKR